MNANKKILAIRAFGKWGGSFLTAPSGLSAQSWIASERAMSQQEICVYSRSFADNYFCVLRGLISE
jgi:hypothetical protein